MIKKELHHDELTPVMRQYATVKATYPDALVLFRMGDFYETFKEDAKTAAKILNITLTKRANGKASSVPLAGFPHHALESYMHKLLKAGLKVAICEQVEDPKLAKGVVKREVIEVVTPGTALSDRFLEKGKNNYLLSVIFDEKDAGISAIDISTGEFFLSEIPTSRLKESVLAIQPSEIICPESLEKEVKNLFSTITLRITPVEDWIYAYETAFQTLTGHFQTPSLKGFGCQSATIGVSAAGSVIQYLKQNYHNNLNHVTGIHQRNDSDVLLVDDFTQRNLEIFQTMQNFGKRGSLIETLDQTKTSMGSRLFHHWLRRPLRNIDEINQRLDWIQFFVENSDKRERLRNLLSKAGDIERLMSKLSANRSSARELNALRSTLELIPDMLNIILEQTPFESLAQNLNPLSSVVELIKRAILEENVSLSIREGGFIKDGFSAELDEYRHLVHHGKEWIARLQATERERLGVPSLKVAYNKVFGYYIEVTKANLDKVPETYIRKQTLVNNERFITPELKEYEEKLLNAEERMSQIEYDLFQEIRLSILKEVLAIQKDGEVIAIFDIVSSLADIAANRHYSRPEIHEGSSIEIKDGRHPVVEFLLPPGEKFIANDLMIDNQNDQILIITGPNMAGKSTYLRQVGLIVLMAQIGSFVPASSARIGIVDKIFTRVGASDNLAAGESTFLMEMNETANILNNVTPQSLILLDEIGRGTSTYDGMSIAWAVTEYLHENPKVAAKTLFATHYHELTELELLHPRIKNYNVAVKEYGDRVIFLRKIVPGGCDRSYGIHVAQMAGIPREVIFRAKEILLNLSDADRTLPTENEKFRKLVSKNENQLGLFDVQESELRKALIEVDVDNLTPLEALQKLDELKRQFGV